MTRKTDLLSLTRVTKDMGATVKPGPMIVAPPELTVTDAQLKEVAAGSGLNGPLIADLIVAMSVHENMGINMYRALRTAVTNPMLRTTFEQFEGESALAVQTFVSLMDALGIPQYYVSPAGRLTEGLDSHMIMSLMGAGSADPVTIDMKAVELVLLGSTMCVANTELLRQIGAVAEGDTKASIAAAVAELEGPQRRHLEWAQQTQQKMATTMVTHPIAHKMTQFAEGAIAKLSGKSA